MFYKSLSSGDDNGEDKDIQKDNETDKYMVDMRDMVDKDKDMVDIRVSHNTHFFELSYALLTTHAFGFHGATKFFFSIIDSKMTFRERFLC